LHYVTGRPLSQQSDSFDPLTGLSNRQQFRQQLSRLLGTSVQADSIGLLLIDVDQLKKVNVSYGQGAGDALIQLIVERIRSCLSAHQHLSRIGGNEFAVVFQNSTVSVATECRLRVEQIVQGMARPFPVAQHAIKMNVSMGL